MRLRCLFGVKDDLHDYAEAVNARMTEYLSRRPLAARDFAGFDCAVLHRIGNLQVELVNIKSSRLIPAHSHPHADSVDMLVAGNVDGFFIGEADKRHHVSRFILGMGLRIRACETHGGRSRADGVVFLSCQRWTVPPSHIALDWNGPPCTREQARLLEATEVA